MKQQLTLTFEAWRQAELQRYALLCARNGNGKFPGEPIYVPYYWEKVEAHEYRETAECVGYTVYFFTVTEQDRAIFGDLLSDKTEVAIEGRLEIGRTATEVDPEETRQYIAFLAKEDAEEAAMNVGDAQDRAE